MIYLVFNFILVNFDGFCDHAKFGTNLFNGKNFNEAYYIEIL